LNTKVGELYGLSKQRNTNIVSNIIHHGETDSGNRRLTSSEPIAHAADIYVAVIIFHSWELTEEPVAMSRVS
jgi:hypothetical protein